MNDFYQRPPAGTNPVPYHLALAALPHFDLEVAELTLLQDDWNTIFAVTTRDKTRYALRISRPGIYTAPEVRSEALWMGAIARDLDLPLPQVIPTRTGDLLRTVAVPGAAEPHHCVLFSWLDGVDLDTELTPARYRQLGILMARMHGQAAGFAPPADFHISTSNTIFHPRDPALLLERAGLALLMPEDQALFAGAAGLVAEALARRFSAGEPPRVIHGDLHQWNVRIHEERLLPFDFEDLTWSYPIHDIAVTFYHLLSVDTRAALQEAFRAGYTTVAPWPEAYPGELARFMARRCLDLGNYMVSSSVPEELEAAPAFLIGQGQKLREVLGDQL